MKGTPGRRLDDGELLHLAESARALRWSKEPSRVLAGAHALRIAHLVDEMVAAAAADLTELVLLAVRPAIEAAAFGLYYATHASEWERAFVGHKQSLEVLALHFDKPRLPSVSPGGPGPLNWDQAWDAYALIRGSAIATRDLKQWYKGLSSLSVHGGFGAMQRYVAIEDEARSVERPVPTIPVSGCLDLVGALLGLLIDELADQDDG